MGIGSGIVLFVIGAILAFAVNLDTPGVELDLIGYILMGAGAVVFLISLVLMMRKRSSSETVRHIDSRGGEQITQHETRSDATNVDPMI